MLTELWLRKKKNALLSSCKLSILAEIGLLVLVSLSLIPGNCLMLRVRVVKHEESRSNATTQA